MRVAKLVEELQKLPPAAEVGLRVFGHHYRTENDKVSHGPMVIFIDDRGTVFLSSDTDHQVRGGKHGQMEFADAPFEWPR